MSKLQSLYHGTRLACYESVSPQDLTERRDAGELCFFELILKKAL